MTVLAPSPSTTLSHGPGQQTGGARTARVMRWAGMALPLGACLTIWILGPDATSDVAWLRIMHQAIGLTVLIWTALRLVRRPCSVKPRMIVTTTREWLLTMRFSLVMLYALLILQPLLAVSGRMLAGEPIVVWGLVVPSVLATNEALAREVAQAHGWNAVVLLALIGGHVAVELSHRSKMVGVALGWTGFRGARPFKCFASGSR
jgi:cytochrome b561